MTIPIAPPLFRVTIESFPADRKDDVIKAIHEATGCDLKMAERRVESLPASIALPDKETAYDLLKELEECNASCTCDQLREDV
jgi:ribosomal protein L7/L12